MSPQFAAAYRLRPEHTVYATVGRGFKAGGFNPASPAGSEAYGEEHTWNVEGGVKTTVGRRPRLGQRRGVPHRLGRPAAERAEPGGAGAVLHRQRRRRQQQGRRARARPPAPRPASTCSPPFGYTHARFGAGSVSGPSTSTATSCRTRPTTPSASAAQYARLIGSATALGRIDIVRSGAFQYNDANSLGQDAYSLVNLRGGVHGAPLAGRGVRPQRVRHRVHSAGVPLSELRAVRVHGRDGRAAHASAPASACRF